jgi:hypothetical protein
VECGLTPLNHGMTRIQFRMVPQADTYHSLVKVWHGVRSELVEQDITVESWESKQDELTYDLKAARLLQYANSLAAELADNVVRYCVNKGIVDYQGYDQRAANLIVKTALVNAAIAGRSDPLDREGRIDLVPDMRACIAEREREQVERQRVAAEAYAQHQAERLEHLKVQDKATAVSFDLLYSFLTPAEAEEAKKTHWITVKTLLGDFKVPVCAHGLAKLYVDGKYKASYCVVFADYRIPVGDEVLMKVALLKTDPERFIKTAHKFVESNGLWMMGQRPPE